MFDILHGVDLIIHAGDIGGAEVLSAVETIAPVKTVRRTNDRGSCHGHIPHDQTIEYGTYLIYVLHELEYVDFEPAAAEISAVICHFHRPLAETNNGIFSLNSGSVGPWRFS